jgi:GntR family transcriptional regulator, transcriptional repressor for pyruvate dehydrogenase complex
MSTGVVDEVVSQIRARILRQNPVEKALPSQSALAAELGISRTAVREAMSILQAQGLIEVQQGKRPQVVPVSNLLLNEQLKLFIARQGASFHQLMEIRLPLEIEVARIAAQRATPDNINQLQRCIDRLKNAKRLNDQIAADRDFHVRLAEATANQLFVAILESFHHGLQVSMKTTLGNVGIRHALRGHRAILGAIAQHDPKLAATRMQQHLKQAVKDYAPQGGRLSQ